MVRRVAALSGVPPADVEDVVQTVFCFLWCNWQQIGSAVEAQAWLHVVTRRTAAVYHRIEKHWSKPRDDPDEVDLEDPGPLAEELYSAQQTIEMVREIVQSLAPDRREVLRRYELHGEAMEVIAAALGVPANSAWSKLRLARNDFKAACEARRRRNHRRDLRRNLRPLLAGSQRLQTAAPALS